MIELSVHNGLNQFSKQNIYVLGKKLGKHSWKTLNSQLDYAEIIARLHSYSWY